MANPSVPIVSVQAWSFNRFTVFEAIERTARAGAKHVEMYPGQTLRADSEVKVGPDMPQEETVRLQKHLKQFGVQPVAFGVTGISKNPTEARKLFAWAKGLGLMVINTESTDAIDTIEMMVKEFNIKVGFHNHPRQPNNPNYKVWDPAYVYDLVKDRDKRIGSCADTGHWVRSGIRPVDAIATLKGRIVSSHLKDLNVFEPSGHDVPFGGGVSQMAEILKAYWRIGFWGPMSVEYEHNWDDNVGDIAKCVSFVKHNAPDQARVGRGPGRGDGSS